jgi:hypothetical protein
MGFIPVPLNLRRFVFDADNYRPAFPVNISKTSEESDVRVVSFLIMGGERTADFRRRTVLSMLRELGRRVRSARLQARPIASSKSASKQL